MVYDNFATAISFLNSFCSIIFQQLITSLTQNRILLSTSMEVPEKCLREQRAILIGLLAIEQL